MSSPVWTLRRFAELTPAALYAALRLRVDVFVVEQHCPYPELDGKDCHPDAWHLFGTGEGDRLLAYCRLLPRSLSFDTPSIGRVVVAPEARGGGLSHALMREALAHCQRLWPGQAITMGAQRHLVDLYAQHGFVPIGEDYLEDGIPHVDMRRDPRTASDCVRRTPM